MRNWLILSLTLAVAGSAVAKPSEARLKREAKEAARLETRLAGFEPGKPVSCIDSRRAGGPESYGETTLLFRFNSKLIYRTETRGGCPRIGHGNALVTRSNSSQICRGDIARAVDLSASGMMAGSCVMGPFVPYRRGK